MHVDHPYLVGLIGTGVGPSLTPALHMTEAAALGIPYLYRTIDLTDLGLSPDDLGDILAWCERLGFDAVNVTHPCKRDVIAYLDRVDETAAALGAVNTVLFTESGRIGHNTDTTGFERAFRTGMPDAHLDRVTQLGAGGAGSAVSDALLRLGVRDLTIVDIDTARATELAAELSARHDARVTTAGTDDLPDAVHRSDGVVHCTPTGMAAHPGMPFPEDLLRPDLWVADIVYRPLRTELLTAAASAGCTTLDGGRMAVYQAVDALELITGQRPDPDRMIRHFHDLVASHEIPIR
ncbi:shikimate dehydrogenase [Microbacterium sp. cx-55]|uniref:shikimate dehydrogenase n=1 Tax=Microbacterium sp. cx-55 TaxID=2875948 RepID=UPI001CBDACA6|nr:shikimate dehydrogenase [Microbacterium sp. cx-55]MBZ4486384.1 shikimate dehydrogenase [Microbacterium sp. cx-55]UGB36641.1 shikimate dehydrogenase [Microbacterium sp. cx-55]